MRVRLITIIATLLAVAIVPSTALAAKKKPTFKINTANVSLSEGGGPATITVTRQSATNISETVHYATSAAATSPATAGSDYTATSGTLNFPAGAMSASFQVPILDDSNFEGPENVALTLSAPTSS